MNGALVVRFLVGTLAVVLSTTSASGAQNTPDSSMMRPVQRWIDAYNSGTGPLPEDVFTDDIVITDEFPPFVWTGKVGEHRWAQAIDAFIRPGKQHVSVGPAESFQAAKERVSFVLPATLTFTSSRTGKTVTQHALWLFVLVRAANRWRIAADTWTTVQSEFTSASVPLHEEHGVLLFEASLDGVGPLLFVLDPGGEDVYTAFARTRLKNRAPLTVCVSRACIPAAMQYFEGKPDDLDPVHDRALGVLAGSMGPQLLRHYVVRVDYQSSRLTLIPPAQFHPKRGEHPLALTFDAYGMPVATALVDGLPAPFELDVRAGTSMLFGPFLDRTGLRRTYRDAPVIRQSGALAAHAVHRVQVNGVDLRDMPFWFSNAATGKFANPEVGGLLANNVLSHFVVTFDEPDHKVFLASR